MTYTQQDQDKYLADRQDRLAAQAAGIADLMRQEEGRNTIAKAITGLINVWGVSGAYEMADMFTCSELEALAAVFEAVGEAGFADTFRWGHAQSHDEFFDDEGQLDVDPELIEEHGERHFVLAPIGEVNQSLTRFVTVNLPDQDVPAVTA